MQMILKFSHPNYKEAIKWFHGVKQFIEKRLHLEISEDQIKNHKS